MSVVSSHAVGEGPDSAGSGGGDGDSDASQSKGGGDGLDFALAAFLTMGVECQEQDVTSVTIGPIFPFDVHCKFVYLTLNTLVLHASEKSCHWQKLGR